MEKKNNNLIILLMGVIIIILIVLCFLFATNKIVLNKNSKALDCVVNDNVDKNIDDEKDEKIDYSSYVGIWYNDITQNEITIKKITDNELTFTWFVYRLTGIDDDFTLKFDNGQAIFYFQGYDDQNFDLIHTEDEKYIRKATIKLSDNSVDIIVEDVDSVDNNYAVLDGEECASLVYIKSGTYTHPIKRS